MSEKVKILDQFRACLKDIPLGTKLKRQEIIDRIVAEYGTNPNSIIPSDYCYNRTNKGKPGSVNFFLHQEDGEYEYVGEAYMGMSIGDVLSRYKADFGRFWADERYKWEAVKHYKETWKIDAPDFASMLAEAFSRAASGAGALLAGGMYYPYKMIKVFAQEDPETVRSMFRRLYDENRPLADRYKEFRASCDVCLDNYRKKQKGRDKVLNHYQDLRAVSVYLSFEYPDTYFLYKYKMYTQFRDLIGFREEKGRAKSEIWKLENYERLCRDVLDMIQKDESLLRMQKDVLDDSCWPDEAYHLLTQTVIYAGSFMEIPVEVTADPPVVEDEPEVNTDVEKNTILYGPPGTGKTYHTAFYAVAVIENRPLVSVQAEKYSAVLARYHEYKAAGLIEFTTFHQSYGYEEFIEGIRPVLSQSGEASSVQYRIEKGVFLRFCMNGFDGDAELPCSDAHAQGGEYAFTPDKNRVFIIDEINRGNISKIFGELITLIEPSKRIGQPEGMTVRLPYSGTEFGVPDNVYLIGTMNTADRSIATIDTALRRRFQFREMQPTPKVLAGISVEDISIQDMLTRMNEKISVLYDREHTVGHAYFMPLVKSPTIETLASIFENSIIPLLQEYFYDDYEKIRLVLGDNNKKEREYQFILADSISCTELFGDADIDTEGRSHYRINSNAFKELESYRSI